MRIGVAAIALEANTFNPVPTTLDDFRQGGLRTGEEIWQLRDAHHEVGGFLSELESAGAQVVPLLAASAAPGGTLTAPAFDELRQLLHGELDGAGQLDGLLLAPHGAMVAENALDADGTWLSEVRERLGPDVPIVATIDPHANLSQRMVDATSAITAYRSNPHIDQRQRGREAARLVVQAAAGEIRLVQAATFPPISIEIERQLSQAGPYAALLELSAAARQQPGVLSTSIVLGFPYADVPELGSATLAVTNNDPALARQVSDALALEMWTRRPELRSQLVCVSEAVTRAAAGPGATCLLDMGDNVGGGSPGDSTVILHELRRQGVGPALAVLFDPQAAAAAAQAGIGSTLTLAIGGKQPGSAGGPFEAEFKVQSVSDGRFSETQPRHGGQMQFDQGLSAALVGERITIIVTSHRCPPFSLGQITHLGIDPARHLALIAKGVHAPVAAYAPVCERFIRVNTPGLTATDITSFSFQHRRRPMYPFELETVWQP